MFIFVTKILTILSLLNIFGMKENNYHMELSSSSQESTSYGDYSTYHDSQYCINNIQLEKARKLDQHLSEVKVGIIDNGIDVNNTILSNYFDTDLSNKYLSENFKNSNSTYKYNSYNHATHVAGIVNLTSNGNARIVNLKSGENKSIDNYKIASAINFAQENNIKILNISSNTYFNSIELESVKNAIENYDGLIICSAGNDNHNIDNYESYPASYTYENIISVGASNIDDGMWHGTTYQGTNYGKSSVDLFAPGEDIYSTVTNNLIASYTGTSMSAPMVTGVAGLLLSNNPSLSTSELKNIILNSVDKIDSLENKCVTGGRLNAYKALMSIHQHSYNYKSNDNGHTYECICGEVKSSSNHSYKVSYDTTTHTYKCVCGETKSYQHSYTFGYIDSKCHGEICECGYYKNAEAHIIKQGTIVNNKAICLGCKTTLDLNYDMGITPLYDIVYITSNGSYKLPNGIIVLTDIDYNSYINGTLSFNYNDMLLS